MAFGFEWLYKRERDFTILLVIKNLRFMLIHSDWKIFYL